MNAKAILAGAGTQLPHAVTSKDHPAYTKSPNPVTAKHYAATWFCSSWVKLIAKRWLPRRLLVLSSTSSTCTLPWLWLLPHSLEKLKRNIRLAVTCCFCYRTLLSKSAFFQQSPPGCPCRPLLHILLIRLILLIILILLIFILNISIF